ncbi:hypothetical protein FA13DRAFT_1635653 [Coprinellus micaceus]|uniref:Prolyl 4-hydroxylase alpha subunit Fe(2+) 2OG dioxygenase domain-containing protein n=1 Tax=Coprinellus micaceus TaxID=71717 RepID=A0A4Y7SYA8_COPMI|nr:hypothetical protein FA13DRAFT_1635653 [Coprinellus micaceus]
MPSHLSENALEVLCSVFPNLIQSIRSVDQKDGFYSLHFSYYNRYCKKGTGTSANSEPSTIRRMGKNNVSTKVNIPRESKEAELLYEYKHRLEEALHPMLQWISEKLQSILPETYERMEHTIDILPLGDTVPAYPFTGFVVNFNVATHIHRDSHDQEICLVFQFSSPDLKGGELVLVEPGLVISLKNGHGILFRSHKITHLNLDFEGERVSLVFHTDNAMTSWSETFNGWGRNIYFRFHKSAIFDPNEGDPASPP